jgi:hypothetical protein
LAAGPASLRTAQHAAPCSAPPGPAPQANCNAVDPATGKVLAGYTGGGNGMSTPGNPGNPGVIEPMPAVINGTEPRPIMMVDPMPADMVPVKANAAVQGRRRALQQAAAAPASFCRPYWWQEMQASGSSTFGYGGRRPLAAAAAAAPARPCDRRAGTPACRRAAGTLPRTVPHSLRLPVTPALASGA